ncbi:MAG: amino acid ABC transporter substrate-binding protein [Pelagibacterium sp. SCN 63-23]|nr:MAG: amino acid ABC transporter substrate-binding protein [Pelagibacterium sp. SCN 63-23]
MGGALLAGALALGSAQAALSQETSMIDEVMQRGVLKVGVSLFTPWAMRDKSGELIGFEIDVANELARDLGVDVEFVPTAWDGVIPSLLGGNFDLIISGMTRTTQRNVTVNFSEPYNYSGYTLLANKDLTKDLATVEDYNSPHVTLVSRRGGSVVADMKRLFPLATILEFDDEGTVFQELVSGNAHATLSPEPTPSSIVRQYPDTMYVPFDTTFGAIGESIGVRKGDADSLNLINNWIQGKDRMGWLKDRSDYWFKSDAWHDQVDQ